MKRRGEGSQRRRGSTSSPSVCTPAGSADSFGAQRGGFRGWLSRHRPCWLAPLGLAIAYTLAGLVAARLTIAPGSGSALWLPSGIALAAVMMRRERAWHGIWLGAFVTDLTTFLAHRLPDHPVLCVLTAAATALGGTLEALAGAHLLRGAMGDIDPLARTASVFQFAALGGLVSCAIGATVGVTSLLLGGFLPWSGAARMWWTWWVGDVSGVLVVTPLLLACRDRAGRRVSPVATAMLVAVLLSVGALVFGSWSPLQRAHYPIEGLFLPVLVGAALWMGSWGAVLSIFLTSVIATWGTAQGFGPFTTFPRHDSLILVQAFVLAATLVTLTLAAALNEHRRAEAALAEARDELESRVLSRTAELQRANGALADALARGRMQDARLYREAQESIRARDEFLCVASHELKTPLTAMLLQVQVMDRIARREGVRAIELAPNCGTVLRQVHRLNALVDSLLDVSRVAQDQLVLEREAVDLPGLVREVVARFTPEALRADCAVSLRTEIQVAGHWDRKRLDQVVAHLLSNALKYGASKPVEITLHAAPGAVRLSVRDQGIGMSPEQQERIFERFVRAVPTRNYGGFGVGLWMVRRIVEALDGHVTVASATGEGATFIVELPVDPLYDKSERLSSRRA